MGQTEVSYKYFIEQETFLPLLQWIMGWQGMIHQHALGIDVDIIVEYLSHRYVTQLPDAYAIVIQSIQMPIIPFKYLAGWCAFKLAAPPWNYSLLRCWTW